MSRSVNAVIVERRFRQTSFKKTRFQENINASIAASSSSMISRLTDHSNAYALSAAVKYVNRTFMIVMEMSAYFKRQMLTRHDGVVFRKTPMM